MEINVAIKVENLPARRVAYIRHLTGYSKGEANPAIGAAFERVCRWVGARDLFGPHTLVIGVPYDNPDLTPNDRCRYDACVTVPPEVTAGDGEVGVQDLPGGKYALGRIEVSAAETHQIGAAVDWMYGHWLPASGYEADDRPALEIYYDDQDKPAGTWIKMDYCLPVRPA